MGQASSLCSTPQYRRTDLRTNSKTFRLHRSSTGRASRSRIHAPPKLLLSPAAPLRPDTKASPFREARHGRLSAASTPKHPLIQKSVHERSMISGGKTLSSGDKIKKNFRESKNFFANFIKSFLFSEINFPEDVYSCENQLKISPAPHPQGYRSPPAMPFGRSQRSTEVPPRPSSHSSRIQVLPDAVPIPKNPPHSPVKKSRCAPRIPAGGGLRPRFAPPRTPCMAIDHFPIKTSKTDEKYPGGKNAGTEREVKKGARKNGEQSQPPGG